MQCALLVPSVSKTNWVGEVLPGVSSAELPIAGRRYIDYALEAAARFNIVLCGVLDWHWSEQLQKEFDDITRGAFPVFYQKGEGTPLHGLNDLAGLPSTLTANLEDGLVVMWGLALPCHSLDEVRLVPISEEDAAETPVGTYRYMDGRWMRVMPCGFIIEDVPSWFNLNMTILKNPTGFTLPGYSAEKGVHIGINVGMEKGVEVRPPIIVGNDAWLERNVIINGQVVIGRSAVVAEGVKLDRTVVCDNTFVGQGLDLTGKAIYGNRVIDGLTGFWTEVDDSGVAHLIKPASFGWFGHVWRFLAGNSMRGRD